MKLLEIADFTENKRPGNESILATFNQTADKIYNIDKIGNTDFFIITYSWLWKRMIMF